MTKANEKLWCVYIHTNKTNNKVYVGITSREPEKRWGTGGCQYSAKEQSVFYRAIRKYGWDGFEHIIFAEGLTEEEAKHMEILLIALYKSNCRRYKNPSYGYNMTDGGDGTAGRPCTKETKAKIGMANTGRTHSKETRNKMSNSRMGERNGNYGKPMSDNQKQILRDKAKERYKNPENHPMYGKVHSEESIEKMREAQETKAVVQLNKNGDFVQEFVSINDAERFTGIRHLQISRCCNHVLHYNTAGGYLWLFKTEYDELSKKLSGLEIVRFLYPDVVLNINGVHFRKNRLKWVSNIKIKGKTCHIGTFENEKDAIIARFNKEIEMFGYDNAPQRHLFEQYGITQQND